MKEWDPETSLKSLTEEAAVWDETATQHAQRLLKENLPLATQSICHIAIYGVNENTRLRAAQYVIDRNLGRVMDTNALTTEDPFENLLADCIAEVAPDGPLLSDVGATPIEPIHRAPKDDLPTTIDRSKPDNEQ
jgi:hypothetical protein